METEQSTDEGMGAEGETPQEQPQPQPVGPESPESPQRPRDPLTPDAAVEPPTPEIITKAENGKGVIRIVKPEKGDKDAQET